MALSDTQARSLLARVDRAQEAVARVRKRAAEESQDYMHAGVTALGAAAVGALEGYRGTSEIAGLPADLTIGVAGLAYAALGGGSKSMRDQARAFGTGALSVYAYKLARDKSAQYARPTAGASGEIIGGSVHQLHPHQGGGLSHHEIAGLAGVRR